MQISPIQAEGLALRDPHPAGKSTIFGLQALRFVAAAMVVITHALNREVNLYHPAPLPRAPWMESGVDIFFVISGFIMIYILKPDTRAGAFWMQRFTRIAPLYWTATIVAFLGGLVLPDWFFGAQKPLFALQSMLFLPLGPGNGTHPLISPGWTLIYEFAFYTILALCLAIRRPPFALAVTVIVALVATGEMLKSLIPWIGYYSDQALMLEFLFGMGAAVLAGNPGLKPWQGLVLAGAGLVLIYLIWDFDLAWPRGIKVGLPAFLVVFGTLTSEPIWQRVNPMRQFARLGDASYAIYIVHFFFVTALATLFQKSPLVHDTLGPLGYTGLAVGLGIGAGLLAHILVEKPLLRLVRGWVPRPSARPAGVPATARW
ncbi:MAG TPA: acyltransferase [Devosiaceae bacterium]|nr:acyltransferase [Devosiaceae bacterium]